MNWNTHGYYQFYEKITSTTKIVTTTVLLEIPVFKIWNFEEQSVAIWRQLVETHLTRLSVILTAFLCTPSSRILFTQSSTNPQADSSQQQQHFEPNKLGLNPAQGRAE